MTVTLWKWILIIVGIMGILFGAYSYGHAAGEQSGYKTAWNIQQATIQAMVDKDNKQAAIQNGQIAALEATAASNAADAFAARAQAQLTRETVVNHYYSANPTTATTCGLDIPLVNAINALITADPTNSTVSEDPAAPSAATTDTTPAPDDATPPVPAAASVSTFSTGVSQ